MFHNVSPSSSVSQSHHHDGVVLWRNPDSPKGGEKRKQTGLSHRALEPQPDWHSFLGRWHQGAPVVNRTLEYWEAYYSLQGVLATRADRVAVGMLEKVKKNRKCGCVGEQKGR